MIPRYFETHLAISVVDGHRMVTNCCSTVRDTINYNVRSAMCAVQPRYSNASKLIFPDTLLDMSTNVIVTLLLDEMLDSIAENHKLTLKLSESKD